MGFLFFDESKHPKRGFHVGAFAYCPHDPTSDIDALLKRSGLQPGVDEFKSSSRMDSNINIRELRDDLTCLVARQLHVAVCVTGSEATIGDGSLALLFKMMRHEMLAGAFHEVYFDQDVFSKRISKVNAYHSLIQKNVRLHFDQDSKQIRGIQIADLVAHTCATMLAETLGLISKTSWYGWEDGFETPTEIPLGYALWAQIRHRFFCEPPSHPDTWKDGMPIANVRPYGLHIGSDVLEPIREAADKRFGEMYYGCIH